MLLLLLLLLLLFQLSPFSSSSCCSISVLSSLIPFVSFCSVQLRNRLNMQHGHMLEARHSSLRVRHRHKDDVVCNIADLRQSAESSAVFTGERRETPSTNSRQSEAPVNTNLGLETPSADSSGSSTQALEANLHKPLILQPKACVRRSYSSAASFGRKTMSDGYADGSVDVPSHQQSTISPRDPPAAKKSSTRSPRDPPAVKMMSNHYSELRSHQQSTAMSLGDPLAVTNSTTMSQCDPPAAKNSSQDVDFDVRSAASHSYVSAPLRMTESSGHRSVKSSGTESSLPLVYVPPLTVSACPRVKSTDCFMRPAVSSPSESAVVSSVGTPVSGGETKAWLSQTIVAQNGGDRPASTESWPGDGKATHAGQSGMAATRGNGSNTALDKLLKKDDVAGTGRLSFSSDSLLTKKPNFVFASKSVIANTYLSRQPAPVFSSMAGKSVAGCRSDNSTITRPCRSAAARSTNCADIPTTTSSTYSERPSASASSVTAASSEAVSCRSSGNSPHSLSCHGASPSTVEPPASRTTVSSLLSSDDAGSSGTSGSGEGLLSHSLWTGTVASSDRLPAAVTGSLAAFVPFHTSPSAGVSSLSTERVPRVTNRPSSDLFVDGDSENSTNMSRRDPPPVTTNSPALPSSDLFVDGTSERLLSGITYSGCVMAHALPDVSALSSDVPAGSADRSSPAAAGLPSSTSTTDVSEISGVGPQTRPRGKLSRNLLASTMPCMLTISTHVPVSSVSADTLATSSQTTASTVVNNSALILVSSSSDLTTVEEHSLADISTVVDETVSSAGTATMVTSSQTAPSTVVNNNALIVVSPSSDLVRFCSSTPAVDIPDASPADVVPWVDATVDEVRDLGVQTVPGAASPLLCTSSPRMTRRRLSADGARTSRAFTPLHAAVEEFASADTETVSDETVEEHSLADIATVEERRSLPGITTVEEPFLADITKSEEHSLPDITTVKEHSVADITTVEQHSLTDITRVEEHSFAGITTFEEHSLEDITMVEEHSLADITTADEHSLAHITMVEEHSLVDITESEEHFSADITTVKEHSFADITRVENKTVEEQASDGLKFVTAEFVGIGSSSVEAEIISDDASSDIVPLEGEPDPLPVLPTLSSKRRQKDGSKSLKQVSFSALALLLDASLEGDLELLKNTAKKV